MTAIPIRGVGFDALPDHWLGALLGRPALRLARSNRPTTGWIDRLSVDELFVTAKLATSEVTASVELQALGFRTVDVLLTFDAAAVAAPGADARVRFARPADRDGVTRIAGSAFQYTRFHLDPAIPGPLADRIKAAWAGNYFDGGRGDGMVVAERDGAIAGFLQLLWSADGSQLLIDLIAVGRDSARQGLARAMIGFAAARGTGDGRQPASLAVGTQAANIPSARLYESLGFRLKQSQFVLHHHGRGGPYPAGA